MSASVAHLTLVPSPSAGDDGDGNLSPLAHWELVQRGAGRSDRTISETLSTLGRLERFTGRSVEYVRPLDISRFLGQPHLKQNSRAAYFGQIHAFYRWWGDNGGTNTAAVLPRPKAPKGDPRPITTEQLDRLLSIRMHHRTRGMILCGAVQGLRAHEIAKVHGLDVDTEAGTIRVQGKGGRVDVLPLHPDLAEYATTMPTTTWWFPGNAKRAGQPITRRAVTQILAAAMERAGIPAGTAHRLRHWYGTELVTQGTDLRTTQSLMRHANLSTTAVYTKVADKSRAEAINRLSTRPADTDR